MTATLTVLGAGSILPREGYGCAAYALRSEPGGPITLFDCGPGTVRALAPAGIGLEQVRRVVFSHFHTDHLLDVFALSFARRNPRLAPPPRIDFHGPPGLSKLLAGAPAVLGGWVADPDAAVHEVELDPRGRGAFEAGGILFECTLTPHTPESLAWRATLANGASLGYSGDTGESPDVAALVGGVDLFVAECSFPDEEAVDLHLSPSSAARMAREAGVGRLVLSHFYPGTDPEGARTVAARTFSGPIELARDGSVFDLRRAPLPPGSPRRE